VAHIESEDGVESQSELAWFGKVDQVFAGVRIAETDASSWQEQSLRLSYPLGQEYISKLS
jgi:hypothetical protein